MPIEYKVTCYICGYEIDARLDEICHNSNHYNFDFCVGCNSDIRNFMHEKRAEIKKKRGE